LAISKLPQTFVIMYHNSSFPQPFDHPNGKYDPQLDPNNSYHYLPTLAVCATFVALYSLSTLLHMGQGLIYRAWFVIPTIVFSGVLEILGWSGRLWSSKNIDLNTPFMIQITGCIIGPTPLLAADFVIFGIILQRLGQGYSRIAPKWYTIVFCSCDVISLVVQAIGGATASQASNKQDRKGARRGGNIMLGGIVFQLCVIIGFLLLAAEYLVRYSRDRPLSHKTGFARGPLDKKLKWMIIAVLFNVTCLFIRAVYRTIELADGWNGRVISTQVYFNVLDGGVVTLAMWTLNIFHPGLLLDLRAKRDIDRAEEKAVESNDS